MTLRTRIRVEAERDLKTLAGAAQAYLLHAMCIHPTCPERKALEDAIKAVGSAGADE